MNSEEEDDQQLEAVSTESPDSKGSWTPVRPVIDDVDRSLDSARNPLASHITKEAVKAEAETAKEIKATTFTDACEGEELEIFDEGWKMKVFRRDSQCSTDTVTMDERSDGHASSPCADSKPRLLPTVPQEILVDDGDDDFGDFEEAKVTLPPDVEEEDEFGDFDEMPSTESSATVARIDSHSDSISSFLTLKGLEYLSATMLIFGRVAPQRPLLSSCKGSLLTLSGMKIHACVDSRLGAPLLYPRKLPIGFLRTSGPPVQLSSKITMTEQRLLGRLGLHETYVRAHRQQSVAQIISNEVSPRLPVTSEMHNGPSVSEMPCLVDDFNLDLDFLVQFSSQHPSGSIAESSRNERDSVSGEDVHRSTYLHELFDGIVESSQSSFISHSSEPSETKREVPSPSVVTGEITVQEPCLSENDWDAFVNASSTESRNSSQETQNQDTVEEEWSGYAVAPAEPRKSEEETKDDDIFSSEWLHQLQSSHASSSSILKEESVHCPVPVSEKTEVSENEWGVFAEAPSCPTSTGVDPFQALVPVVQENERMTSNQGSSMMDTSHPMTSAPQPMPETSIELDLSVLESFVSTEPLHSNQKTDLKNNPLAMDLFTMPVQSQGGCCMEEDDEWGGFQG